MENRFFIYTLLLMPFAGGTEPQTKVIVDSPEGPIHDAAVAARFVVNNVNWAAIGTVSTNAVVLGYAMTNILGMVDGPLEEGEGIPYILMSHDITGRDISKNPKIALSVSLAQIGYCQYNNLDEQDPRCVRVNFIGTYINLSIDDPKYIFAKGAMKARHPCIDSWDDFYMGKLYIQFIAVLDYFGGPKIVPVDEYLSIQPYQYRHRYYAANLKIGPKSCVSMNKLNAFCPETFKDQISDAISRFIIHNADWGMVTTFTYNNQDYNLIDGLPFNSLVSIADGFVDSGSGIPYLYVSPLEFLVKHVQHDNRVSLLLTLAGTKFCKRLDAISDHCPAVILTGSLMELEKDSIEYNFAQMALFSRHASMARLPQEVRSGSLSSLSFSYGGTRLQLLCAMGGLANKGLCKIKSMPKMASECTCDQEISAFKHGANKNNCTRDEKAATNRVQREQRRPRHLAACDGS